MKFLYLDTETELFGPGNMHPPIVCVQYALNDERPQILTLYEHKQEVEDQLAHWLDDDNTTIVGHYVAYDMGVLFHQFPWAQQGIFDKYKKGLVLCTKLREKLIRIATGEMASDPSAGARKQSKFDLATVVKNRLGLDISEFKNNPDGWRLRYAELKKIPLAYWPKEAVSYALDDITNLRNVFRDQCFHPCAPTRGHIPRLMDGLLVRDEQAQARADFCFNLLAGYGVVTDKDAVFKLAESTDLVVNAAQDILREVGFLKASGTRNKPSWSKDMKKIREAVSDILGDEAPTTPSGLVSTSSEVLEDALSLSWAPEYKKKLEALPLKEADDFLKSLNVNNNIRGLHALQSAADANDTKIKWVDVLLQGTRAPIHAFYNSLVETGRTSCFKPNMQNPKRKGGVRECFVPRPGYTYVFADYSTVELRCLAQVCRHLFGYSKMGDAINAGMDLHILMAARLNGKTYEETLAAYKAGEQWAVDGRQLAKAANFGIPGGLGADSFAEYAKATYGVVLDPDPTEAKRKFKRIKSAMYEEFPELKEYHTFMGEASGGVHGVELLEHVGSGRFRGEVPYCAACNSLFQGMAADGAKAALFLIMQGCYVEEDSWLYGCRPVFFLHDEFGLEVPEGREHEAAQALEQRMKEGMEQFVTDYVVEVEAVAVRRWLKGAKPVKVDGRLVPGKFDPATKKWIPDISMS